MTLSTIIYKLKLRGATMVMFMAMAFTVDAKDIYSVESKGNIEFTCSEVEYRHDIIRIYGQLIGRPHTANRIDMITMVNGSASITSNDIDGIDYQRWFQWEDNGKIPIEIDIPYKGDKLNKITIKAQSPRGDCIWMLNRISN